MKKFPLADTAITALAPVIWGSTYIVATEILPAGRPFTAAAVRALPAGLLLVLFAGRMLARHLWWRVAVLAALNIGAFQAFGMDAARSGPHSAPLQLAWPAWAPCCCRHPPAGMRSALQRPWPAP